MQIRLPWMSRRDRNLWRSARTLADLGQLMAGWLEGDVKSWPGYQPNYGPDDETTDLIPVLARLNRAGFVTDSSQPGVDETEAGRHWRQRAAVSGFINDGQLLHHLLDVADREGLYTIINGHCDSVTDAGVVTTRDGIPVTAFGSRLSMRDLHSIWPVINRHAFDAVAQSIQLTLVDPQWGSGDHLWRVLANAIDHPAAA